MRNTIIIVDEHAPTRNALAKILSEEYNIVEAADHQKVVSHIQEHENQTVAILLNLILSKADGFALLQTFEKYTWSKKIPIFVICHDPSVTLEKKLFEYGVTECIHKPFDAELIKTKLHNIIRLFQYQNALEEKVFKQTESIQRQYQLLKQQAVKLKHSNEQIIDLLGTMVEYRNLESGEHIHRVKKYTEILATELMNNYPEYGLTPQKIAVIVAASSLHDIGKITIPDTILLKPGKLNDKEFEYMKSHTISGCEILDNIKGIWDDEYVQTSMDICRHHHERYDGNGYPDHLVGSNIPLSAQIVSIADVYDALINERVYKDAIPKEQAFRMIISGECGTFSPVLLECFRNIRSNLETI